MPETFAGGLRDLVFETIKSFFLTPIMIAIYRFLLVDEIAGRYTLAPSHPRFRAFFLWQLVLSLATMAFSLADPLIKAAGLGVSTAIPLIIVMMIVAIVVFVRLTVLFPAIAIDAPGAGAANAVADSKGHGTSIFMIYVLTAVPFLIALVLIVMFSDVAVEGRGTVMSAGILLLSAAAQVIVLIVAGTIAARIFQALAARLVQPV